MLLTIIVFLIILGVLIFAHELGHFVTARRSGVRAEEFGFGFPPRVFGFYKKAGKWNFVWGKKPVEADDTVYSLNLIPLGGFVKIKGEDGGHIEEQDSFPSKKWFTRIKILAAGVIMNFLLAWLLIWIVMMLGIPESVDNSQNKYPDSKIQIAEVVSGTPAEVAGIQIGDQILKQQTIAGEEVLFTNVEKFQQFVEGHKSQEFELTLKRGSEVVQVSVSPRTEFPDDQGALGVSLVETSLFRYSFFRGLWESLLTVFSLIGAMLAGIYMIIKQLLLGGSVGVEVTGPVGIAVMTKQVTQLGLVYILQFAAILSINLGIINALPIPALDGGRILFILIERFKGSPISQKTEQIFHTVGFMLLIGLMILVTFRDVWKIFS